MNIGKMASKNGQAKKGAAAAAAAVTTAGDGQCKRPRQCGRDSPHETRRGESGVFVWGPEARDVNVNLSRVFSVRGRHEAAVQAAIVTAQRSELLARCHSILRAALHNLIEGKVGSASVPVGATDASNSQAGPMALGARIVAPLSPALVREHREKDLNASGPLGAAPASIESWGHDWGVGLGDNRLAARA